MTTAIKLIIFPGDCVDNYDDDIHNDRHGYSDGDDHINAGDANTDEWLSP